MNRPVSIQIALMWATTVSALVFAGCASAPRDTSALESKISQVESDSFGTCMTAAYTAGAALQDAQMRVEMLKEGRYPRSNEYERAEASVEKAANYRQRAETACEDLWSKPIARLESDFSAFEAQLGGRVGELEQTREIVRGVTFHTGSAILKPQAMTVLDVVANRLIRKPIEVEIAGHASSTGNDEANLRLSQRRAEAVRDYLIKRGVNPSILKAKGYGVDDPIASNDTLEGRLSNQRVELRFAQQ